jgi:GPH family glycoside/pentoside/hexuronide:cation symporter/probable glucitol transport protein GutA
MTLPSIGGIIGVMMIPKLAAKFGKKKVVAATNGVTVLILLWIFFIPADNITMLTIATFLFGLCSVGSPLILSMLADAIDYAEYHTGVRADGAAYATNGLASKAGSAVAGVGVSIMAAFGYVANAEQTAEALRGINITVNLVPAICFALAFLVTLTWNLDEEEAQKIRSELDENHIAGDK